MDEASVMSIVNELEQTALRLREDSTDGQSSVSTACVDYQRLMEGHERRAAVLEEYRRMVKRRRQQCEQQKKMEDEEEGEEGTVKHGEESPASAVMPISERHSANETSRSFMKTPKAGMSIVTTTTTTNNNNNNSDNNKRNGTGNNKKNDNTSGISTNNRNTTMNASRSNSMKAKSATTTTPVALSVPSRSYKWTRPRGALACSTESSLARQRPRVNSAPPTPHGKSNQPQSLSRSRTFVDVHVSPLTTPPLSSVPPSRCTQLAYRHNWAVVGDVVSPLSSSPLRSLSRLTNVEELEKEKATGGETSVVRGEEEKISRGCGAAEEKKKEEEKRKEVEEEKERRVRSNFLSSQIVDLAHGAAATCSEPFATAAPNCHEFSTLEIATEEDKQLLKHRGVKSAAAPSVSRTKRGLKNDAQGNNAPLLKSTNKRGHLPPREPISMNDSEGCSFTTSVSEHSIEDATPMLKRFGRNAEEGVSATRRGLKRSDLSTAHQGAAVCGSYPSSDDAHDDMHACGNSCSGRPTEPKRIPVSALNRMQATNTADVLLARSAGANTTAAFTAEDKAACIATVAGVLQGLIVQIRRVFPCYYCGEVISISSYRLHLDFCKPRTEALYLRYGLNPLRLIMSAPLLPIPAITATDAEKDAFARACYCSVMGSVLLCPSCEMAFRIHDLPEHQSVCGNSNNRSKCNQSQAKEKK